MKDMLHVRTGHDAGVLRDIASLAHAMPQWPDGPHAVGFQQLAHKTDLLVLELSLQTLLKAAIAQGNAAAAAGKRDEAEDILAAIAIEAGARAQDAARWKPATEVEARPTSVEKMAYTAGYVDGGCGCPHRYTGQIGVAIGDEGASL